MQKVVSLSHVQQQQQRHRDPSALMFIFRFVSRSRRRNERLECWRISIWPYCLTFVLNPNSFKKEPSSSFLFAEYET